MTNPGSRSGSDPESAPGRRWIRLGTNAVIVAAALVVLRPFLVPVAWAGILAFSTWPVFRRTTRGLGGRTGWAALVMTLLVVLIIVGPTLVISLALAGEIRQLLPTLQQWVPEWERTVVMWASRIPWLGAATADWLDQALKQPGALRGWVLGQLGSWMSNIAGAIGDLGRNLARAGIALLTLFYAYRYGGALVAQLEGLAGRFGGESVSALLPLMAATIRAVMYGTLLTAVAQGVLAMLGYWMVGLRAPVLLGALTALLAFVPFGAPMVYLPASAWLFIQQRPLAGLLLILWGVLAVSTADNVIRSWLISGTTRVPFLLGFFGLLGGLAAFGSLGLFVGPIAVTLLLVLWRQWTGTAKEESPRS